MDSTSSSSRRKAPSLDPEDFASWEMMFQNYCGYQEWELFWTDESEIDEAELENLKTPEAKVTILTNLSATKEES